MDPEPVRGPGEPGSHRFPAPSQRGCLPDLLGDPDDRRGVDGMADGLTADLCWRSGLRSQVGYGVDARHARLHVARPDLSQISPQSADLSGSLRLLGKLRSLALAR